MCSLTSLHINVLKGTMQVVTAGIEANLEEVRMKTQFRMTCLIWIKLWGV